MTDLLVQASKVNAVDNTRSVKEKDQRVAGFLLKQYGLKTSQQLLALEPNQMVKTILIKEVQKVYKYPEAAFSDFDFKGRGYIEIDDFLQNKIMFRLPFSKEVRSPPRTALHPIPFADLTSFVQELRPYFSKHSIFKKQPKLQFIQFTKAFFPQSHAIKDVNLSDSDEDFVGGVGDTGTTVDGSSMLSSNKNRDIQSKLKAIEDQLMERLSSNWVSVRKAFLDLDLDYDGFVTAEELAKVLGGAQGSAKFDYNLLKMLINLRTKGNESRVNFNDFCSWFGSVIEPTEGFYFRHDSIKNPQYERNIEKTVLHYAPGQKKAREMITGGSLKSKFIEKLHRHYKSLQKAFIEMNKSHTGYIQYEEFREIIFQWGFEASEDQIKSLFTWLDFNKDGSVSYDDLRHSAGREIAPMEQLFFRQDMKPSKAVPCKYEKCWENNNFNERSQFCPLHQKIMRTNALDLFARVASTLNNSDWEALVEKIQAKNFQMTVRAFSEGLAMIGYKTTKEDKLNVAESFRVNSGFDLDNDKIDSVLITMQAFVNARKQTQLKRLNELISLEQEDEQLKEDSKLKNLAQVDDKFLLPICMVKKAKWGGIWKAVRNIDKDSNGFLLVQELEEVFKDQFPLELESKSLRNFFHRFVSVQNKQLVDYRKIKTMMNEKIIQMDAELAGDADAEFNDLKIEGGSLTKQNLQTLDEHHSRSSRYKNNNSSLLKITSGVIHKDGDGASQASKFNRSLTPMVMGYKRDVQQAAGGDNQLPKQDMSRNQSIQNLNAKIDVDDDLTENKYETPIKSHRHIQHRASLNPAKDFGQSLVSKTSTIRSQTLNKEIKNKLAYEWKNIFRALSQIDQDNSGLITVWEFQKYIHQARVYLSREELRKLEVQFSDAPVGEKANEGYINYLRLSQDLGLHRTSMDYIRNKSMTNINSMEKVKLDGRSTASRGGAKLSSIASNKSFVGFHKNSGAQSNLVSSLIAQKDIINNSNTKTRQQKIAQALDFVQGMDKQGTGLIPLQTLLKVARIYGIHLPQKMGAQGDESRTGMVDYTKVLRDLI